jgi:hypothetical protein
MWAVLVSGWAQFISAIVPWFEAVDALVVGAVANAHNHMLAWTALVVLIRSVGIATDVAFG